MKYVIILVLALSNSPEPKVSSFEVKNLEECYKLQKEILQEELTSFNDSAIAISVTCGKIDTSKKTNG